MAKNIYQKPRLNKTHVNKTTSRFAGCTKVMFECSNYIVIKHLKYYGIQRMCIKQTRTHLNIFYKQQLCNKRLCPIQCMVNISPPTLLYSFAFTLRFILYSLFMLKFIYHLLAYSILLHSTYNLFSIPYTCSSLYFASYSTLFICILPTPSQ